MAVIIAADQITKALVPHGWVSVDPGTGAYLPSSFRTAWKGPVSGALLDGAGVTMLGALGWMVARRLRQPLLRVGGAVLVAGLASNLVDRLGLAALTQGVGERGVVNWFFLGFGPLGAGNIADCCYVLGPLLLCAGAAVKLARSRAHRGEPRTRPAPVSHRRLWWAAAAIALVLGGVAFAWTGFWQGDTRASVASAQATATRADLRSVTYRLDEAVLEAYVHGDPAAVRLLPLNQWIACDRDGVRTCVVATAFSTGKELGDLHGGPGGSSASLRARSEQMHVLCGPLQDPPNAFGRR